VSGTTTIRLELSWDGESLSGVAVGRDAEREFTGWIGLLAAIDELAAESVGNRTLPRPTPR
jgi:hypothetical protein